MRVDHRMGALFRCNPQHAFGGRCHEIAAEDKIGSARGDAHGRNVFGPLRELEMGDD